MKNQGTLTVVIILALAIASFFFVSNPPTGNAVADVDSCEDKLSVSDSQLSAAKTELSSCIELKAAAITDMSKLTGPQRCDTSLLDDKIAELNKQKSGLLKNLKEAQDKSKECVADESELEQLNNTITELARNSANNICCKMRVDNPNIKAYNIDNNKVNCLESGDLLLNCP